MARDNTLVIVANNLRSLRESRGLTFPEVSLATGIAHSSLYKWESSGGVPLASLAKLCDVYKYYDIYKLITVEMRFAFKPLCECQK